MNLSHSTHFSSRATALLVAAIGLATACLVRAQATTFALPVTASNYATGSALGGGVVSSGSVFSNPGPVTNNLTSVTFGQNFSVSSDGTSAAGTGAWLYQGLISGASINALTVMPISYDFTLAQNGGIVGNVDWVLYFRGGTNSEVQIANGTLSGASATFIGSANDYTFTTGATAGTDTYRAYLGVSFTNNLGAMGQGIVSVTMADIGYGGPGITLNASAIPEPSTYAAIAGAAMLGFAIWRRRQRLALATTLV